MLIMQMCPYEVHWYKSFTFLNILLNIDLFLYIREKGRDLSKSFDKSPYTQKKIQKSNVTTQEKPQKPLHNDCGPT